MKATVEFVDVSLDITYHVEGRYYAAGPYAPSERPVPVVERCFIQCGDFRSPCQLGELPHDMQESALQTLQEEIDSLSTPDYEEA